MPAERAIAAQADLGYSAYAMHASPSSPFPAEATSTIFLLPPSEGRLEQARRIALLMLGDTVPGAPKIANGVHPDVIELVAPDQKERIGVDQVRDAVRSGYYTPTEAQEKLCLIPHAEGLTMEAANALLKTLEEPPPGLRFVLLVSDPSELLPTILSRSRVVRSIAPQPSAAEQRLVSVGYQDSTAGWLSRIPLHEGDVEILCASSRDLVSQLRATADEIRSCDSSSLVEHCVSKNPVLRRQAFLMVLLRVASRDPDLLTHGVRFLAAQDRASLARFLRDMQQVAYQLLHPDPLVSDEDDPLSREAREAVGQRQLRALCLALDDAHRSMAAHGPIEAILLSLLLASEGEAYDD